LSLQYGFDVLNPKSCESISVFNHDLLDGRIGQQFEELRPLAVQARSQLFYDFDILQTKATGERAKPCRLSCKIIFLVVRRHSTVQHGFTSRWRLD
jgi:hypothetical protein